jgi:hypothetical protein
MNESTNIVGRWTDFIRIHPKVGIVVIVKTYQGKDKVYALKMFNTKSNPDKLDQIEKSFNTYKNCEVKANYGLGEMSDYKGRINCSEAICWNIEPAGADPEPVKEDPTIERESSEPINEEDDLPF